MKSAKLLLLAGDFVEDYEIMVPFQALQMVGHTVDAVCPGKKKGEQVRTAIHDFEGDQTYSEKRGHNFTLNATFDDVKPGDYDALVIPGRSRAGISAPERAGARDHSAFRQGREADCRVLPWTAIAGCGGCVEGRKLNAYPACAPEVELAGGTFVKLDFSEASWMETW